MTATKAQKKTPKPTAAQCAEYLKAMAEKRELEQKAKAIGRKTSALHDQFKLYLTERGKESLKVADYRLTLIEGSARVPWKDKYIDLAGPVKAQELQENAERPKKVDVQKAA